LGAVVDWTPASSTPEKAEPRVFSLVIPPPNVTGSLHIGRMLEHTEIDVGIRCHRMRGDNTLWLPGTDHTAIATQMVVERQLAEEGLDRRTIHRAVYQLPITYLSAKSISPTTTTPSTTHRQPTPARIPSATRPGGNPVLP
jgi:valyl-tRNA synthetase